MFQVWTSEWFGTIPNEETIHSLSSQKTTFGQTVLLSKNGYLRSTDFCSDKNVLFFVSFWKCCWFNYWGLAVKRNSGHEGATEELFSKIKVKRGVE
jgi:hypothetical protein